MNNYGKVFRDVNDNCVVFQSYNPDKEKYYDLIRIARDKGLKQVIINSELMTNILFITIQSNGVILKINMTNTTDQDIKDNVKSIISKLRNDHLLFTKLKDELEWAEDSNSIDISSIEVFYNNKKYQIYSNGIITGDNLDLLFKNIIKSVMEEYLNG